MGGLPGDGYARQRRNDDVRGDLRGGPLRWPCIFVYDVYHDDGGEQCVYQPWIRVVRAAVLTRDSIRFQLRRRGFVSESAWLARR
jgi:hypothetical protein